MLSAGAMGFGGLTGAQYGEMPDRLVVALLTAERDDEGRLVPERKGGRADRGGGPTGSPSRAMSELPAPESLGVPDAAMGSEIGQSAPAYVVMFWQVMRERGLGAEEALARWRAETGPRGWC